MSLEEIEQDAGVEVVGAFEAKTHLSRLLRKAHAGVRIVITQRGKPVAQLTALDSVIHPINPPEKRRGDMKGRIWMADDFCDEIEDMREYME